MLISMVSEHASPLAALGGADAGGQNVHVGSLARALADLGHKVTVHTRRDDPGLPRWVTAEGGVRVHHVDAGPPQAVAKDNLRPYMEAFADGLAETWQKRPPDAVHAHFWMSGLAALAAARPVGVPVVQTFHALGAVKRRHQGAEDTSPPDRLRTEEWIMAEADRVIATCHDEVGELRRLGAPAERLRVVPCGVDLKCFRPGGPVAARSALHRLVVVGRLVERKGVGDVIAALATLPGTELLIAGGGPRHDLETDPDVVRLGDAAQAHGVADRVRFLGQVTRGALPSLLRSADTVVCVPTYEPFGIVPLEAMACGVPVVAAAVGGLKESVVDGVTGVHVPPGDPDRLAAVLAALLADPAARSRLGAAGMARARNRYGWPRVAAATASVYDEMVGAVLPSVAR